MASGWLLFGAVVWLIVTMVYFSKHPRRKRLVEVYPKQSDWWLLGGSLTDELEDADRIWLSFESGDHYLHRIHDKRLLDKIERMVFLAPDSQHVDYLARLDHRDSTKISKTIEKAIEYSQRGYNRTIEVKERKMEKEAEKIEGRLEKEEVRKELEEGRERAKEGEEEGREEEKVEEEEEVREATR